MKRMKQKISSSFGHKRSLARSTRPIMVLQENKSQVARKHRRVNTEFTTICTRQVLCLTQKASGLGKLTNYVQGDNLYVLSKLNLNLMFPSPPN